MFTEELLIHYIKVVKQNKLYIRARRVLRLHRQALSGKHQNCLHLTACFYFHYVKGVGLALQQPNTTSLGPSANLFSHTQDMHSDDEIIN